MRTTRTNSGTYTVSGHTREGVLVQYEVKREGSGWHTIGWFVDLVYGEGQAFDTIYATKAQAVQAIINQ